MNKMFAVLKREYLHMVRKKSFIIITLLMPVFFGAIFFVPALLATKAIDEKRIVVVDGTGRLEAAVSSSAAEQTDADRGAQSDSSDALADDLLETDGAVRSNRLEDFKITTVYVDAEGAQDPRDVAQPYIDRMANKDETDGVIDGVLVVPGDAFHNSEGEMSFFSRSATDLIAKERLARIINDQIQEARLAERGISAADAAALLERLSTSSIQVTRSGEEKKGGDMQFMFAFVLAGLLIFPTLVYGQEVLRGIVQEKTDRVVEILISSMSPMQLLSGKILGLALVGLTQLAIWVGLGFLLANVTGSAIPAGMSADLAFIKPVLGVYFFIFFVLGYLLYVCFYAIAGAACNNEKEAQQFAAPVMFFLLIPWFLMMPILLNPESTLSVVLSLIPFFAPITMFARMVVSEPALWQIALAIGGTIAVIIGMFWVTAKIFRVGILSYGKRPTIPELWRWLKVA